MSVVHSAKICCIFSKYLLRHQTKICTLYNLSQMLHPSHKFAQPPCYADALFAIYFTFTFCLLLTKHKSSRETIAQSHNFLKTRKVCKDKVVLVPFLTEHHAKKTYLWSVSITPRILVLGTRWR